MLGTINVHRQLGKGNNYPEISGKFGVVASKAYEKGNTTGTDENLFRPVPLPKHCARVLPLELMPVHGHGAQISARAPANSMFRLVPVPGQLLVALTHRCTVLSPTKNNLECLKVMYFFV